MGNTTSKTSTTAVIGRDTVLSPSSSVEDICAVLIRMSSSVTVSGVMEAVAAMPTDLATRKIASFAVGAAMSAKKAVAPKAAEAGLTSHTEWMIGKEINFSMFVMLGHLIMSFETEDMGPLGIRFKPYYQSSIGGKKDIRDFGKSGVIEGKEMRASLLRKWCEKLEGTDIHVHQEMLALKFPDFIRTRRGFIAGSVHSANNVFARAFNRVYSVVMFFLRPILWLLRKYLIVFSMIYLFSYLFPRFTVSQASRFMPDVGDEFGWEDAAVSPYYALTEGLPFAYEFASEKTVMLAEKFGLEDRLERAADAAMQGWDSAVKAAHESEALSKVGGYASDVWSALTAEQVGDLPGKAEGAAVSEAEASLKGSVASADLAKTAAVRDSDLKAESSVKSGEVEVEVGAGGAGFAKKPKGTAAQRARKDV